MPDGIPANEVSVHEVRLTKIRLDVSGRDLWSVLAFAMAYFLASGYGSLFDEGAAAPLWFPDSVLLCALLLTAPRKWWLYLAAALPIRLLPGAHPIMPYWFVAATTANDLLKSSFAAYFLRRVTPEAIRLANIRTIANYVGIAVLLIPAVSAIGGAAARNVLGYPFWPAWNQWFLGNALANLVLTPALLYWCLGYYHQLRGRWLEIALWTAGFATSIHYGFSLTHSNYSPIALYAPVPFLVWAAMRFGPIGASSALSLIALLTMFEVSGRPGTFSAMQTSQNVLFVQLFLAVLSIPMLALAILIEQRRAAEVQLRESEKKLSENYDRVRDLAGKLINAQEDERKRIAIELHDDLGQRLSLLAVGVEELDRNLPGRMIAEREILAGLKHDADQLISVLHDLSHRLHSSSFQHLGLVGGLRGVCRTIAQQHHINVDLNAEKVDKLPYELSLCLFRIAQEALNNAVKHGGAKQIQVVLVQESNCVRLVVRDEGSGFDTSAPSQGLGLVSMHERLRPLGGRLNLTSRPGQGTVIEAEVEIARAMRMGAN